MLPCFNLFSHHINLKYDCLEEGQDVMDMPFVAVESIICCLADLLFGDVAFAVNLFIAESIKSFFCLDHNNPTSKCMCVTGCLFAGKEVIDANKRGHHHGVP